MNLPPYTPPSALSAWLAVAGAPVLLVAGLALSAQGYIDNDSALALLAGAAAWLLVQMQAHQRALARYHSDFVQAHLAWRSPATLRVLAQQEATPLSTRAALLLYLAESGQLPVEAAEPLAAVDARAKLSD